MKLSVFSSLCLIGTALAAPANIETRDLRVVQYNINRVNDAMKTLDRGLKQRPGRDQRAQADFFSQVVRLNQEVVKELRTGAAEVRDSRERINDIESLQLSTQFAPILTSLRSIVDEYINIKRYAQQANAVNSVLDTLLDSQVSSNSFVDAVLSKQSVWNQAIGQGLKGPIEMLLNRAINEYKRR